MLRFVRVSSVLIALSALGCEGRFTSTASSTDAESLGGSEGGGVTENGNGSSTTSNGNGSGGDSSLGVPPMSQAGNDARGGDSAVGGSSSGSRGGGSAVGGDSGFGGGSALGGSSVGGSGVGGESSVGGGGNGVGGSGVGGAGAVACEDYADVRREGSVTLHVKNETEEPIVLGPPASCQPVSVTIESLTNASPGSFAGLHCLFTCEMSFDGVGGCTADCPFPPTVRIEPGGTYDVDWNGLVYEGVDLPQECCESECSGTCQLPHVAQAGSYKATVALADSEVVAETAVCPDDAESCELQTFLDSVDVSPKTIDFELSDGSATIVVK